MAKRSASLESLKKRAAALAAQNRLREAKALYLRICNDNKRDSDAWFALGMISAQLGDMTEAERGFQAAVTHQANFPEAHFNLAKVFRTQGLLEQAANSYQQALHLRPNWVQAMNNLGNVLQAMRRYEDAAQCYRRAIQLAPNYFEAHLNYGNLLLLTDDANEAAHAYRRATAIKPDYTAAWLKLGTALVTLGELDEAAVCYQHLARLHGDNPELLAAQAKIYEMKGQWRKAYEILQPALEASPRNAVVAVALASICHHVGRCDETIDILTAILTEQGARLSNERLIEIHFALGKLYDKQGRYDRAFEHFKQGNGLKPGEFDVGQHVSHIGEVVSTFSADYFASAPRARVASERPVFIVGMPRSGTSLVEQILASHPQVAAAGELNEIRELMIELPKLISGEVPYPQCMSNLTTDICDHLAQRYLDRLKLTSSEARYVTDKMPQNFLCLGVIAVLFPDAHIIHCTRDPLDTCISCYFQNFTTGHFYSHQLDTLGAFYRSYERIMVHWKNVLPLPILEVNYEALVEDQKGVTQRILDYLDLPWDDNCLLFYQSERYVRTASYDQVRQPLYKDSVGRWKNYAAYCQALKDALNGLEKSSAADSSTAP